MLDDNELEKRLYQLGKAVSPQRSVVADVIAHMADPPIISSRSTSIIRVPFTGLRRGSLALSLTAACIALLAAYLILVPPQSLSVFADEALSAIDRARANGVTVKEHTVVVLRDGSRSTSSTVSTFLVGQDSYRRDIYEGDQLREVQWYTPENDQMLQTSVRYDTKSYALVGHTGSYGKEDPVVRMCFLVRFVDDADRQLEPMMIRGRECQGFEIRSSRYGDNPHDWVDRIWFDPKTKLPARIELERPADAEHFKAILTIQDEFNWHPDLPVDTFMPKVPAGFTKQQQTAGARYSH